MHGLQELFYSDLPIPVWQIVFYVGLISYFMVQRWFKLSFLTSFILALYWLHYAFRADLVSITSEAHVARAIYYVLGFALILLSIFALTFLEVDTDSLLEKREKEITFLKAQAKTAEKSASALQAQLEKDQSRDSNTKRKLEKKLNAKIEKVEHGLQAAESLLETRNTEISALQAEAAEAQKNASALEALLEMYQTQESNTKKKLAEELNAKIEELKDQLQESENLLKVRDAKVAELQVKASEAETDTSALRAQEGQAHKSTDNKAEEELSAKIEELQHRLQEGASLLEKNDVEIRALQDKASEAETNASAFRAQLEHNQAQVSANKKLEEELNARIAGLEDQLKQSESRLEQHNTEVAGFKAKASEADKKAAALKAQLEKDQSQGSVSKRRLEEKFNAKMAKLENQLKQSEGLLEKRNAEITELQAKASEAERNSSSLKAQLQKDQTQAASTTKELEEELSAKIEELQHQLQESAKLLEQQNVEITELQAKASEAETNALADKAQLEKEHTQLSAATKKLEEEFKGKIAKLEDELKQDQILLENRNTEITAFKTKASEAEQNASTLKAQLEKDQSQAASATKKLEEELRGKIAKLEDELKQDQIHLENRNAEITALKAKASEAEKNALAGKAQFEKEHMQLSAANKKLQEEFNASISTLEDQLKQSESLVATRNAELADFSVKAAQAEKEISAFKARLEKDRIQSSAGNRKFQEEYNAKIATLESQLKQGEILLKTRNSEIATLQAKVSEAERSASALKGQLEKGTPQVSSVNKKLEEELNAKIAKLESQLKEGQSLLESRNAEIAEFNSKAAAAVKNASTAKPSSAVNRQSVVAKDSDDKSTVEEDVRKKLHQFQYAVKYLEDEIKEKDRLLSLMTKKNTQAQASTKNAMDEAFKKKIHQLEQSVKYLEDQGKEKDGLLGLMAKRNRELADLKSKAEERLEALEANSQSDQTRKANQGDIASER
jgi:chromosome segregation ATPase